jgi:hypothetical protein
MKLDYYFRNENFDKFYCFRLQKYSINYCFAKITLKNAIKSVHSFIEALSPRKHEGKKQCNGVTQGLFFNHEVAKVTQRPDGGKNSPQMAQISTDEDKKTS